MQKPEFNELFNELGKIALAEELFGIDFPIEPEVTQDLTVSNPREVVDYYVLHLGGRGPNPAAAHFLKEMATKHNNPTLAEGLHGSWRRDQISAVIREIFDEDDPSTDGDDDGSIPVKKPGGPKAGGRAAAPNLDEDNPSSRS